MNIHPSAGNILILPIPDEERTKSGIILAPNTIKKTNPYIRAVVIEAGTSTKKHPTDMFRRNTQEGQAVVLVPRGAGTVIEQDGVAYKIISVDDIVLRWDNTEPRERNT